MLIKKPELLIPEEDPFQNDKLEREESIEILTSLLKAVKEPFVLSISSPWGTGKTIFIQLWKQYLLNESFRAVYFNAWENDFVIDPIIAFMGEIQAEFESMSDTQNANAKKHFEQVKSIGGTLAKKAIPVVINLATRGIINTDEIIETALADLTTEIAKEQIKNYEKDKKDLKNFRENLEKFANEIVDNSGHPLIFFVDELDRCKPTYTIALLERLKHLFNVKGIVFVLVLDKEEIGNSINSHYGISNTDGYLRRFIDLEYRLPEASPNNYFSHLSDTFGFETLFANYFTNNDCNYELEETFTKLSEVFNLSLRQQEQAFSRLSIALHSGENPPLRLVFSTGHLSLYRLPKQTKGNRKI